MYDDDNTDAELIACVLAYAADPASGWSIYRTGADL
jgi:hypothetical protein